MDVWKQTMQGRIHPQRQIRVTTQSQFAESLQLSTIISLLVGTIADWQHLIWL